MSEYRGVTAEHFLTSEEIEKILAFARATDSWEKLEPGGFWDNRVVSGQNIHTSHSEEVGALLLEIRNRTAEKIKQAYSLPDVYADLTCLVRWFPGQEQPLHADDMKNLDGHEQYHHREFGSIIYLNDDYSGGRTYYSQHSIEVIPQPGLLAVHPGDSDHMHGVSKIEDATRYTIASFWTTNKTFGEQWGS